MTKRISELCGEQCPPCSAIVEVSFCCSCTLVSRSVSLCNLTSGCPGKTFAKVIKSADETICEDTVLSDDSELLFAAAANKTYLLRMELFFSSGSTPNWKMTFTGPSGVVGDLPNSGISGTADTTTFSAFSTRTVVMAAGVKHMYFSARIITAGSAGNVNFQWAQDTSDASDTKVLQGSTMWVYEI